MARKRATSEKPRRLTTAQSAELLRTWRKMATTLGRCAALAKAVRRDLALPADYDSSGDRPVGGLPLVTWLTAKILHAAEIEAPRAAQAHERAFLERRAFAWGVELVDAVARTHRATRAGALGLERRRQRTAALHRRLIGHARALRKREPQLKTWPLAGRLAEYEAAPNRSRLSQKRINAIIRPALLS